MPVKIPSQGVFFATKDYLGFWRRFLTSVIDILAVLGSAVVISAVPIAYLPENRSALAFLGILVIVAFSYQVVLKRSRVRTLGYRLFSARIVSLSGDTPSVFQMIERLLFVLLGPLNYLIDLLWLSGDDDRQSIRDKWAATYVVHIDATPEGTGPIIMARYGLLGANVVFPEVRR